MNKFTAAAHEEQRRGKDSGREGRGAAAARCVFFHSHGFSSSRMISRILRAMDRTSKGRRPRNRAATTGFESVTQKYSNSGFTPEGDKGVDVVEPPLAVAAAAAVVAAAAGAAIVASAVASGAAVASIISASGCVKNLR